MHFGALLALKMCLVTTTMAVLCERFRIITAQICVYYCIIVNILTVLLTLLRGPDQLTPQAGCSPWVVSWTTLTCGRLRKEMQNFLCMDA